jgi:hypothetical protein
VLYYVYVCCPFQTGDAALFNSWGSNQWNEKKDRSGTEDTKKDTHARIKIQSKSCKKENDLGRPNSR